MSPLYLAIGKQLALDLLVAYATSKPNVAAGLILADNIMKAQAAVSAHNAIIVRAQGEGWKDDDPRWDAPLAEQQARMDAENTRHGAMG